MANEQPQRPESTEELDMLAAQIFGQRVAAGMVRGNDEVIALDCYRKADAFLAIKKKVKAGALKAVKPEGPQLADCHAPKLKRTHPINLVSQVWGDLAKVNRIGEFLARNPTPESNPEELVDRVNREFSGLEWDLPTINCARTIFPAYAAK